MALEVSVREGESQDSLLRRFQRMVQMDGILREVKAHRYFVSKRDAARLIKADDVWQYNVTYMCLLDYTGEVAVEKFYGNLYALMNI